MSAAPPALGPRRLPVLGASSASRGELPSEPRSEPRIEARLEQRAERVHILTGAVCNNNCIFCMEEDREGREEVNSRTDDALVRFILEQNAGVEEVCFTSGEPTTNPSLPRWVRMAKDAGVPRVSIMTNGRALSYDKYTRLLIGAGMRRFYVSIHGHDEKLHEGLTRTPGSFAQTVEGLRTVARYKRHGIELHTSTVVTRRNLPHLGAIYRFLRELGVDQVVFNVMQANGRANTYFEKIFPRYTDIARAAKEFVDEQAAGEPRVMAFFVDIPLCTTEGLPDFNRGYVERYAHYEPARSGSHDRTLAVEGDAEGELVRLQRADLDHEAREKRAECRRCRYDAVCEGVWSNYLARYGWEEMQPVALSEDRSDARSSG
jgi:cyclic pyranopterin phosphate synthase